MQNVSVFKKIYKKLNPAQAQAVDTIEGPVMVIAGPGTGKTQVLTLRIANILLKTQINPENILALTFTDSAVLEMRKRLSEIIGTPSYRVEITTFHSFTNEVIKMYPEDFPHLIASSSITEIEQIQLLEEVINESNPDLLKPFGDPFYYLKYILSAINDLKKEGVSVEDFKAGIEKQQEDFAKIKDLYHERGSYKDQMKGKYSQLQRNIRKQSELLLLYDKYQELLKVKKLYDFNDMLLEVIDAISRKKDLLLRVQEIYQYILVDEHQDTNTAQNKLIELLANFWDNPNLFVVGDEKQAIYRFQGASLENFLYFQKLYPSAVLINLHYNYRSTQTILNAATSLIAKNITSSLLPKKSELKSTTKHLEEKIKIGKLDDFYGEYYFIASEIEKKLKQNVSPKEIAILSRNNRDLIPLAEVLEQKGIKYVLEADQNIFTDPQVKKLLLALKAVNSFGDEYSTIAFLHSDYLKLEPMDVYRLMKYSISLKLPICEMIDRSKVLDEIGIKDKDRVLEICKMLKNWKMISENENLETLFVQVLNDSGLLDHVMNKPNSLEIIDKLTALFEEVKLQVFKNPAFNLSDFLSYIDLLKQHDLLIKRPAKTAIKDAIRLMTSHKAKGLEFEYVFIINSFDTHWGNLRRHSKGIIIPWEYFGVKLKLDINIEESEDERRLFYVSITRAKKGVMITYSTMSQEGREQIPSQFIAEIDDEYKEIVDTSEFREQFSLRKEVLFSPKEKVRSDIKNAEFFKELFFERGLSISGLNNYLTCPWRFFYCNLLKLPEVKNRNLMFGTVVHEAISRFIKALNNGKTSKKKLIEFFLDSLSRMPISEKDFNELVKKGKRTLSGFYEQRMQYWKKNIQSEVRIKGIRLSDDVVLNGIIDMIEKNPKGTLTVYDFKTGRPRSRAEIEGKTAGSDGNYLRQLVFYRLLLDRYYIGKFRMKEGVIEFIESDDKGRIKSERFEITNEQLKGLESQIAFCAREIINLSFWDRRCGDKACRYCELRNSMV